MVKVVKKDGSKEDFKPDKLKRSLTRTGCSEKNAQKIVDSIKAKEGMKTSEIRKQALEQLRKLEPKAGKKYESFKKPTMAKP